MKEFSKCILCTIQGKQLYEGLIDRLLGLAGTFNLKECPTCGLLWLDPMPIVEDISKCYAGDYFCDKTSEIDSVPQKRFLGGLRDFLRENIIYGYYGYTHLLKKKIHGTIGRVCGMNPLLRSRAIYGLDELVPFWKQDMDALIVDVGCGAGDYLKMMQKLGWRVLGIEPHPAAAAILRKKTIPVIEGTLFEAKLPDESVDYVTMSHVIEHVPEPALIFDECFRILKKTGKLIVLTPNGQSFGSQIFGRDYYPLDPPRHLFLFSPKSFQVLFGKSKFKEFKIKTLTRSAQSIYDNSVLLKKEGKVSRQGVKPQKGRLWFALRESILYHAGQACGEEIEAVASKT
jgi:SAM-dependent methyltransferase